MKRSKNIHGKRREVGTFITLLLLVALLISHMQTWPYSCMTHGSVFGLWRWEPALWSSTGGCIGVLCYTNYLSNGTDLLAAHLWAVNWIYLSNLTGSIWQPTETDLFCDVPETLRAPFLWGDTVLERWQLPMALDWHCRHRQHLIWSNYRLTPLTFEYFFWNQ